MCGIPTGMSTSGTSPFLRNLRASRLLDDAQSDEIEQWAAGGGDDTALARALVAKGLLTKFQAEHLLAGYTKFFVGPYTMLDRIGGGGMGRVFKAVHRQMRRTVAIKVLTKAKRADPQAQARFMREVRASAKLNHPNIVVAYDVGDEADVTYLVMEYVQGTSLSDLIDQQGKIPPAQAADIARQVALGLDHAHSRGVVHRDIKPSNVLVSDDGTAKVLDMGLARFAETDAADDADGLTREGVVMGTIDYLSPEQALDSHRVDTRADIYSLGCTLYRMLTGQVPFPGGTVAEKLIRHQMRQPEPITTFTPEVAADLIAVVDKMMAKRPEDRHQTPAEVADALAAPASQSTSVGPADVPLVAPSPPPPAETDEPIPAPESEPDDAPVQLHVFGVGRRGRVSRLIVRAESMLANWGALRQTLADEAMDTEEAARLIGAIAADYRRLPPIMDTPGTPGHQVMKLIVWNPLLEAIKHERQDLEQGESHLAEFVAFQKHVLRGLNERPPSWTESWPPLAWVGRMWVRFKQEVRRSLAVLTPMVGPRLERVGRAWALAKTRTRRLITAATMAVAASLVGAVVWGVVSGGPAPDRPRIAEQARTTQREGAQRDGVPLHYTNTVGMTMVYVPPGAFRMGSPEGGGPAYERPQHGVTITRGFYVSAHETTTAQYLKFSKEGKPGEFAGSREKRAAPATHVTWDEAHAMCEWLSRKEGRPYRLPTEAEWEYACRAGSATGFCFGDSESGLGAYAWYGESADGTPHPVGAKRPNPWGLFDMHGNAAEWCQDWYAPDYYGRSPASDPPGPGSGRLRVRRGGTYRNAAYLCRSADRAGSAPARRSPYLGFRVVASVPSD